MNDGSRQMEAADQVEVAARRLAHSTRRVPYPPDSYALLGVLGSTATSLSHVAQQLAHWHDEVVKGVEHFGEDKSSDGRGAITAAQKLRQASVALARAAEKFAEAHSANGVVRWNPTQGSRTDDGDS